MKMRNARAFALALLLLLVAALCFSALATTETPPGIGVGELPAHQRVYDLAGLLSQEEIDALEERMAAFAAENGLDIGFVAVQDLEGETPMVYADDFYDNNGYGEDGLILLIALDSHDIWVSTCGAGITKYDDVATDWLVEQVVPYLQQADFAGAVERFVEASEESLSFGSGSSGVVSSGGVSDNTGGVYGPSAPQPRMTAGKAFICFLAALGLALLVCGGMYLMQRGSIGAPPSALAYRPANGFALGSQADDFLTTHTSRRARPKESSNASGGSSTHTSSSGRSHEIGRAHV